MNKECFVSVLIRVSGQDEPAHDFASESIAIVGDVIASAIVPGRELTVVSIEEKTDDE